MVALQGYFLKCPALGPGDCAGIVGSRLAAVNLLGARYTRPATLRAIARRPSLLALPGVLRANPDHLGRSARRGSLLCKGCTLSLGWFLPRGMEVFSALFYLGLSRQFSGLIVAGLTLPAAEQFQAMFRAPHSFPRLPVLLGADRPAQHHHCAQGEVE